jgi:alkaline phosphatase D
LIFREEDGSLKSKCLNKLICTAVVATLVSTISLGLEGGRKTENPPALQVNPVGERPEHEALAKLQGVEGFITLLRKWEVWPEPILRYFEAVYAPLAVAPDATYADLSADPLFQRLTAENGITHLGGPMLGCVGTQGAKVWMRTVKPAKVEVVVNVRGEEKRFGPIHSSEETDLSAVVEVTGLDPGATHRYSVLVDGKPIRTPRHAAITTTPDSTQPSKVRIAFGSCPHRWGLGNMRQAELIRTRQPAALVLYGDIAAQGRGKHRGLMRADYFIRDTFSAWKGLSAAIPVYATWDDHDYLDNDLSKIPEGYTPDDRRRVWEVFRHSWVNPGYGFGDERGGVFLRSRVGPCDILMIDSRYFREKGSFLGEEQMQWLESQLLDCKGPFIILSSGTMWSDYVSNGKDSWGVWDPAGRERLFSFIEKNRIGGVLLVSGDRHGARAFRIPRPSGFTFYEFEPASLGGRSGPAVTDPSWSDVQLFGYSALYAFGELTIDATLPDPEVTFRLIREDGEILQELTFKRSQLTPGT